MADPLPHADSSRDASMGPAESATPTPRWVKVFAIIALLLVLLVGGLLLVGGGNHGPGRHTSGDTDGQKPRPNAPESGEAGGHKPPVGGHTP